jgi:hypothetical protein
MVRDSDGTRHSYYIYCETMVTNIFIKKPEINSTHKYKPPFASGFYTITSYSSMHSCYNLKKAMMR